MSLKNRHLYGAGAGACAVCCAAPLLTFLGIAGAAATIATLIFAGLVFGVVVGPAAAYAVWSQRRQARRRTCAPDARPVDLELSATRDGQDT